MKPNYSDQMVFPVTIVIPLRVARGAGIKRNFVIRDDETDIPQLVYDWLSQDERYKRWFGNPAPRINFRKPNVVLPEKKTVYTETTVNLPVEQLSEAQPFDFSILKGIGPKKDKQLHSAGITTSEKFLSTTNGELEKILGSKIETINNWKNELENGS